MRDLLVVVAVVGQQAGEQRVERAARLPEVRLGRVSVVQDGLRGDVAGGALNYPPAVAARVAGYLAHHAEVDDAHGRVLLLGHLCRGGREERGGVINTVRSDRQRQTETTNAAATAASAWAFTVSLPSSRFPA